MSGTPPASDQDESDKDQYLDIHPGSDVPEDEVTARGLRGILRKLVRPKLPERRPAPRGVKIPGPGPVHRSVIAACVILPLAGCGDGPRL